MSEYYHIQYLASIISIPEYRNVDNLCVLPNIIHRHQKEALNFMIQRETGQIPAEFRLWKPIERNGQSLYVDLPYWRS